MVCVCVCVYVIDTCLTVQTVATLHLSSRTSDILQIYYFIDYHFLSAPLSHKHSKLVRPPTRAAQQRLKMPDIIRTLHRQVRILANWSQTYRNWDNFEYS
jgi:hypothetical protein